MHNWIFEGIRNKSTNIKFQKIVKECHYVRIFEYVQQTLWKNPALFLVI